MIIYPKVQKRILAYLKKTPRGASCSEISKKLRINRVTMTKYLGVMHSQGLVDYDQIGMANVWYLSGGNFTQKVLFEFLFGTLPRQLQEDGMSEKKARKFLSDVAKKAVINVLHKDRSLGRQVRKVKTFKDAVNLCCHFSETVGDVFEYELEPVSDNHIVMKIKTCPYHNYVKKVPFACYSCRGLKLGLMKAIFDTDIKKINAKKRIALGDSYCLIELKK